MHPTRPYGPLAGLLLALLATTTVSAAPLPARLPAPPPEWLPHYDLDIHLDIPGHVAHVRQRVTWTNRSAEAVHEIIFNAHSRYVVPSNEVGLLAKTLEILRMNANEGIYTKEVPFDLHKAVAGGQESAFFFTGDTQTDLIVPLPAPLPPGQAVVVDLDYTMHLPQKQGRWGQWEGVTFLSNWLPVVAVHDDHGWHPTPFVPWHQPFFNEAGLYTVRVVLPADQKIACSGTITGRRDSRRRTSAGGHHRQRCPRFRPVVQRPLRGVHRGGGNRPRSGGGASALLRFPRTRTLRAPHAPDASRRSCPITAG